MAAGAAPAQLPPWDQLTIAVTDPTKQTGADGGYTAYKISVRTADGEEVRKCWRRFREFEESFKALREKARQLGLPALPEPPPKKAFGRFDPKFLEERRQSLEGFLVEVKKVPQLCDSAEFKALMGQFGGGGYLRKLGARTIALKDPFKTRWFEITGNSFDYFEKQGGKKLGTIPLDQTRVMDCAVYSHAFCIMGAYLPRTYILVAENAKDKMIWWHALDEATGGSSQQTGIGATEGVEDADNAEQYYKDEKKAGGQTLKDFDLMCVVGVGSFGKVMKVKHRTSAAGDVYAMKVLNKEQIIKNKMVAHTNAEKHILETIHHPYICRLHFAFQTKKQLIFILDFLAGGELFYHLQKQKRFSEARSRFYTSEIALAVACLHSHGVIYRDLKPENLVLDGEGHVVLTDFGLAKTGCKDATTYTFCGTPEYMAPELVTKQGHTSAVDWWSLGIFLYEMIVGIPPFYTQNVSNMYNLILTKPLECPKFVTQPASAVIHRLLDRDPRQRLTNIKEMEQMEFFSTTDWGALERREVAPEFVPNIGDGEEDTKYFDSEFTQQKTDLPGGEDEDGGKNIGAQQFNTFAQG